MASRSEITANRAATGGWRHRRLSANKLYLQSQGKHARLADDTNHNRNQTPARSDIAASANHRYLIGTYASRDAQRHAGNRRANGKRSAAVCASVLNGWLEPISTARTSMCG